MLTLNHFLLKLLKLTNEGLFLTCFSIYPYVSRARSVHLFLIFRVEDFTVKLARSLYSPAPSWTFALFTSSHASLLSIFVRTSLASLQTLPSRRRTHSASCWFWAVWEEEYIERLNGLIECVNLFLTMAFVLSKLQPMLAHLERTTLSNMFYYHHIFYSSWRIRYCQTPQQFQWSGLTKNS